MKYLYSIVLLALTSHAMAANITARLSHNPVSLDESFHLIYEADAKVDDPDFSVVSKDFEILSSSQSTNMRSINGSWSLKKSWDLVLISKQAGVFTIPPVSFGKAASPAVRVTVKPSASNTLQGGARDAYFLEVSTDKKTAWVGAEIIYTVRFLTSVPINRPTLSELETSDPDAIIEKLGQAANYQKMIEGTSYSVSELRFAVYPQHSGTLTFKPLTFEGRVASARRSSSLFDQFMQSGTLKRLRSKSLRVTVKPRPTQIAAADWLPAERLSLDDAWSEDITGLRTAEPVTRTLTIRAEGLTGEQLDDPELAEVDGVKQYPDKAVIENRRSHDGITGIRQIKVALIPTQAGRYVMPEISIPWWNTRTGQQEIARLPERVIQATGKAGTAPLQPALGVVQPPAQDAARSTESAGTQAAAPDRAIIDPGYWPWISLALATGWITTTLLSLRRQRTRRAAVKPASSPPLLPLQRAVEKACNSGDAARTKDALLTWAAVRWAGENITSLADIAAVSAPDLSREINALNAALYSARRRAWDPIALRSAFHAFLSQKQRTQPAADSVLEPLYKT